MPFIQGKELASSVVDRIMEHLTAIPQGSVDPFWRRVDSGGFQNEGYVLQSTGKDGNAKITIRLNARQNSIPGLMISLIEDYQPNVVQGLVGVATNETVPQVVAWATSSYSTNAPVTYWLSFDKDKIIIVVAGEKTLAVAVKTLMYIGMPERMYATPAIDNGAAVVAVSRFAENNIAGNTSTSDSLVGYCKVLRDRALSNVTYSRIHTLSLWKSKGWGDVVLPSDIYLSNNGEEGYRSRMSGIKSIQNPVNEFRDLDEISVGTKRYIIHNVWAAGGQRNCFTSAWLAVEKIQ